MERKKYLTLCQKNEVTKDVVVRYNGEEYSPKAYVMWFNSQGDTQHTARIISKNGTIIEVKLSDIEENDNG